VGLPVAICAKLMLTDKITERGVILPLSPEIYNPVLHELESFGIQFLEMDINPPRLYENDLQPWS
jgi:hypothetical protein